MKKVFIYTDGACSGNPGPGGWGAVLLCRTPLRRKEISGAEFHTTNNRMELMAVIRALESLREPCEITVATDSRYLHDAFARHWIERWQRNGWKTSARAPVKNQDLWARLLALLPSHAVRWEWIRAHNDHPENERADRLAVAAREALAKGA
ncbi:MAG: ribonuclease HI [Planctomycetota bacterium]